MADGNRAHAVVSGPRRARELLPARRRRQARPAARRSRRICSRRRTRHRRRIAVSPSPTNPRQARGGLAISSKGKSSAISGRRARISTCASSRRSRRCRVTAWRRRACSGRSRSRPISGRPRRCIDYYAILSRVDGIARRDDKRAQVEQILRARLTYQGTRLTFSTERDDDLYWLMTGTESNAARTALLFADAPGWKDEMPRLVGGSAGVAEERRMADDDREPLGHARRRALLARVRKHAGQRADEGSTGLGREDADAARQHDAAVAAGALAVTQDGSGKPWVTVKVSAAVALKAPFAAAIASRRPMTPVDPAVKGVLSRGDIVRVRLDIDAQSDMTWVVVNDPIPAGATMLGSGLGRDSEIATARREDDRGAWPAFVERGFDGYRAYYDYLPKGKLQRRIHGAPEQRRHVRPAADARRSAVRAVETFGAVAECAGGRSSRSPRSAVMKRARAACVIAMPAGGTRRTRWPTFDASARRTGAAPTGCCSIATASRCSACASTRPRGAATGCRSPTSRRRCARRSSCRRTSASTSMAASTGAAWPPPRGRNLWNTAHARRIDDHDAARRPARSTTLGAAQGGRSVGEKGRSRRSAALWLERTLAQGPDPRGLSQSRAVSRRDRRVVARCRRPCSARRRSG